MSIPSYPCLQLTSYHSIMCAVILSNTFKGTFAPIAFKLVDIGGGNKSNMSCGGSFTGAGAKQLANLTKTLFDCEVEVRH